MLLKTNDPHVYHNKLTGKNQKLQMIQGKYSRKIPDHAFRFIYKPVIPEVLRPY